MGQNKNLGEVHKKRGHKKTKNYKTFVFERKSDDKIVRY